MVTRRNRRRFGVILIFAACLCGCGSDLRFDTATVTGTVTYNGKPLDHGEVVFVPLEGTPGPQAVGTIQTDGSFEMRSGNVPGVAVGKHRVTVHCRGELTPEQAKSLALPKSLIPEKYGLADTTPLTYEVEEGRDHVFPINLED